jgi:hypothetical protein
MVKKKGFTEKVILEAQKDWGDGIIAIGRAFMKNQDYRLLAREFINKHYGFGEGTVLFKPTLAAVVQFRDTFEKALSYFVAGNSNHSEDKGFAIKPWVKVKFENTGIIVEKDHALAMGNYFFTDVDGNEVKVEYTFGYFFDASGEVKINLHHSSLPYSSN